MTKPQAGDVVRRERHTGTDGTVYEWDVVLVEKPARQLWGEVTLADGSEVKVTFFGLTHVSVHGHRIDRQNPGSITEGDRFRFVRRRYRNDQQVLIQEWRPVE